MTKKKKPIDLSMSLFSDEEMGVQPGYIKPGNRQPSYPIQRIGTYIRKSDGILCYYPVAIKPFEVYVQQAHEIWGNRYDYSRSVYTNNKAPINIYCPKHDYEFTVGMAQNHVMKAHGAFKPTGCPVCSYEKQHGVEYGPEWRDYLEPTPNQNRVRSKNTYRTLPPEEKERRKAERAAKFAEARQKRKEERQRAYKERIAAQKAETQRRHKEEQAWRAAQRQLTEQQRIKAFQEMFLREAPKAQGAEYQYRGVENIKGRSSRVMVHCGNPNHQWHEMLVWLCLDGSKCRECAGRHQPRVQRCNTFLEKAYIKYGHNMFDLSRVPEQYVNNDTHVEVKCLEHNYWYKVTPDTFLRKSGGCPICNTSKGEMKIILWLNEHGIKFEKEPIIQHNNPNCKRSYLKPDFWLPDYNLIIEYNGLQHYEDIDYFKKDGEWTLEDQQERDRTMRKLCKDNGWQLLEIPYTEFDRVGEILSESLNLTKKSLSVKP